MKTKLLLFATICLLNSSATKAQFFKKLWSAITSPVQPVWGEFEEPGHRNQEHYTHFNNWHLDVWCNNLSV